MDDRNQARPEDEPAPGGSSASPPPSAAPLGTPPEAFTAAPDALAGAALPAPDPHPGMTRGLVIWLVLLLVLGVGGVAFGFSEAAALVALAGLYIAAQAADLDPRFRLLYWMLTWVIPLGGALAFLGIAALTLQGPDPGVLRVPIMLYCGAAAALSLLLGWRRFADPIAVRWFREDPPGHALRLTTRLAVMGVLLAPLGALLLHDRLADYIDPSQPLLTRSGLIGQLVGMVVLALAGVGFLVRRDARATMKRLGLEPLTVRQLMMAAAGTVMFYALNAATEQAQRLWFPDLWAADHAVGEMMTRGLGVTEALILGVSAGVGEELTMRGALQPRMGLFLTSALFAALHVQYTWFGMGVILLIGLTLGAIRQRSSTTVVVLIHTLYDILAVLTT